LRKKESYAFIAFMSDALIRAKELAGGSKGLAELIGGITPQAISQWKRVPVERVIDVERITGISRHELRPDIYGAAPPARSITETAA